MAESEEELKSFLKKVKEESEKVALKLNIQKTKIMASGPVTSWRKGGEKVEAVTDFIFWGLKSMLMVTAAMKLKDSCSLEGKLCIEYTKQSIEKPRHHFADKDPYSQSYGFSSSHVWMWELDHKERSALKNWRTDVFELWCWRRLLRVPWTARRSSQSILKEIRPEYSLEGLMLKLKL